MDLSTATVVGQTLHDSTVTLAIGAILTSLVKLASLVIAGFAGRLLNTKLNVENSTWKQKLALRLVCYAENKILGDKEKQAYVARELGAILGHRVSDDEIAHLIEEAVIQLQVLTSAPATVTAGVDTSAVSK